MHNRKHDLLDEFLFLFLFLMYFHMFPIQVVVLLGCFTYMILSLSYSPWNVLLSNMNIGKTMCEQGAHSARTVSWKRRMLTASRTRKGLERGGMWSWTVNTTNTICSAKSEVILNLLLKQEYSFFQFNALDFGQAFKYM